MGGELGGGAGRYLGFQGEDGGWGIGQGSATSIFLKKQRFFRIPSLA